jgi:hypothetical protein
MIVMLSLVSEEDLVHICRIQPVKYRLDIYQKSAVVGLEEEVPLPTEFAHETLGSSK